MKNFTLFLFAFIFCNLCGFSQDQSIGFLFPADNSLVPEEFVAKFEVDNFSIPADGSVKVLMESESFDDIVFYLNFETDWIQFSLFDRPSATLTIELVDGDQNQLVPRVYTSIDVNPTQSINVSSISELRAGNLNQFYKLSNNTFSIYERPSVKQTYLDDGTAAILMDDFFYTTIFGSTTRNGYTEFICRLDIDNGVLKAIPYIGSGAMFDSSELITSNNPDISFTDLNNNFEAYESEVVTIESGNFTGLDSDQVFIENTNYNITNGTESILLTTLFDETDYIGTEIPEYFESITGIISEFDGSVRITPLDQSSIVVSPLSTSTFEQEEFNIYPNPTTQNIVNISSSVQNKTNLEVSVLDLLGNVVQSKRPFQHVLNVSGFSKGVYLVKIENERSYSIKKLIIN